nr:polyadenylate-binding protein 6-like [Ipomoea batatas]
MVFVSFPADQSADCSEDEEDMKFALKIQSLSLASFPSPSLPFIQTGLSDDAQAGAIAAIVESFKCAPNSTFSIPLRIVSRLLQQEDHLREKFSKYGKVHKAIIMRDEKGKSRGFGFVNFYSHEDAKRAVDGLNGALLGSKQLVFVTSAKDHAS